MLSAAELRAIARLNKFGDLSTWWLREAMNASSRKRRLNVQAATERRKQLCTFRRGMTRLDIHNHTK